MDAPWHGLIHCGKCNALHSSSTGCPFCGEALDIREEKVIVDGVERIIYPVAQGAIPWSTFVILRQIRLEIERPLIKTQHPGDGPAQRLIIVVLFWTLFEILIEAFFRAAFADLPGELADELLQRFPTIGGRLDRLYRRTWGTTFWADLREEGFGNEADHLLVVQERRNSFVHGDPEAISDALVNATLSNLEAVQRGWIRVFNKRCTGRTRQIRVWEVDQRH